MRSIRLSAKHEQQQARADIPGHDSDQQSSKQQKPLAAASATRPPHTHGLCAKTQSQQQQQESHQPRHEQPQHATQVPQASDVSTSWLPVLVYQAAFTAELGQLCSSNDQASTGSSILQPEQGEQQQEDTIVALAAGNHVQSYPTSALHNGGLEGSSSSSSSTVSLGVIGHPASQSSSVLPTNCACSDLPQHQSEFRAGGQSAVGISCSHGMLSLGGVPLLDPGHVDLVQQQWCSQVYHITSWMPTWAQPLTGLWSEHYKMHDRDPANVQMAPWVAKRYKRLKQRQAPSS